MKKRAPWRTEPPRERNEPAAGMENNFKKVISELLVLFLLQERDMHIMEVNLEMSRRSDDAFRIIFPYAVIYRMLHYGCIVETEKRRGEDGRLRQYYGITETGRAYYQQILEFYLRFSKGVEKVLASAPAAE